MKKRPNPGLHMAWWGFGSGFILAISYLVVLLDLSGDFSDPSALLLFINPGSWWLGLIFGAIPGAAIGAVTSVALWRMLRNVPLPFHKEDMLKIRPKVYTINFLLTLVLAMSMIFLAFGNLLETGLLFIPPVIAAFASTYAAHRYMFRLRLWSGGSQQSRKAKAKNEVISTARLIDQDDASGQSVSLIEQSRQERLP